MTTEEVNKALRDKNAVIIYNGAEYKLDYVKTWCKHEGLDAGVKNTPILIPCNGADSTTEALMRRCEIKQ